MLAGVRADFKEFERRTRFRGDARVFSRPRWGAALRQRTRWVTGIALQGWQRFGWSGRPGEIYWLWRDRKGLLANPLSLAANVVFVYGLATALWTRVSPGQARLAMATMALQIVRIGVAGLLRRPDYGLVFALGVPVRAVYANALNTAATVAGSGAIHLGARARAAAQMAQDRARLPGARGAAGTKAQAGRDPGQHRCGAAGELASALAERTPGLRLGEYLVGARTAGNGRAVSGAQLSAGPAARAKSNRKPCHRRWRARCRNMPSASGKCFPSAWPEQNLFVASPEAPGPKWPRPCERSLRSKSASTW